MATIYFPEEDLKNEKNYLYPKGFYYAWAFSNTNLSLFLELNHQYGEKDPTKVSVGMAEIVGFTGLETFADGEVRLAVYTLPERTECFKHSEVLVPTIQTWMRILDQLGCAVPLQTSNSLTQRYASLGSYQDVVDVYSQLSDLSRNILLDVGYAPADLTALLSWQPYHIETTQQKAYQQAVTKLGQSPYNFSKSSEVKKVGETTHKVFANLADILATMDPKVDSLQMEMTVRAALAQGQDASALNTTVGVGYNTYPNPFVCKPLVAQTIAERYTGREFILLNRRLDECEEFISFKLKTDENANRSYLKNGWCRSPHRGG